jgi:hypothetical protein
LLNLLKLYKYANKRKGGTSQNKYGSVLLFVAVPLSLAHQGKSGAGIFQTPRAAIDSLKVEESKIKDLIERL